MRQILLDLCDGRWLSRTHLAQIVNRNPEDLRNRYINPMVSEGKLELHFPETPRRDDQAYRTVSVNSTDSDDEYYSPSLITHSPVGQDLPARSH